MEISNNIFNVERHRWESCFNSTAHESDTFLIKLFFEGGGVIRMRQIPPTFARKMMKRGN